MPFVKRTVEPNFVCRDNPLLGSPNVLEDQSTFVWTNYLCQLSSISSHSNEIIGVLEKGINRLNERYQNIESRIKAIHQALPNTRFPATERITADGYVPCPFQLTPKLDESSLALSDMPIALREQYNKCEPLPNFYLLDKYRTDELKTSNLYSNPGFFFQAWLETMNKDLKVKKNRKKQQEARAKVDKPVSELPKSKQKELAQKHDDIQTSPRVTTAQKVDISANRQQSISKEVAYEPKRQPTVEAAVPPPCPTFDESVPPPPGFAAPPSFTPAAPAPPISTKEPAPPSAAPPPAPDFGDVPPPPPPCDIAPPPFVPTESKAPVGRAAPPKAAAAAAPVDSRDSLLSSIRTGKSLRKVEVVEKKPPPASDFGNDVAAILSQRINAMAMSDSEDEDEDNNEDWD